MREANEEREKELLELGRPNRYTSESERTFDYVVFESDLGRMGVEQVLNKWLHKGKITGAVYVKHDKDRYSRLDTIKGTDKRKEGKLKLTHYHVMVQFKEPHTPNNAWLEFRDFLNKDAQNTLNMEYAKYCTDKEKGDRPFPVYHIGGRLKYYMHNTKAYSGTYTQKDLHQIGTLREEQTNEYGATKDTEISVTDEQFNLQRNNSFLVYAGEDIREKADLAENIATICSAVGGKLYLDTETGSEFVLHCKDPKTKRSIEFLLNMKIHGVNVGLPESVFTKFYDNIVPVYDTATPEDILQHGYCTFTDKVELNEKVFEQMNMEKDGY